MKWIFVLILALFVSGCVEEEYVYADGPGSYQTGTVVFCDDFGCREVTAPYYYTPEGAVVYWDVHFGCWIGPHGYWRAGVFYPGFVVGYHGWYHHGYYHWHSPGHYYQYHYHHGGSYHGGHYYYHGGGHHR